MQGPEGDWTGGVPCLSCELPALTRKRSTSFPVDLWKIISCSHHFLFQAIVDEAVLEAAQKAQVLGLGPSVSCGRAGHGLSLGKCWGWRGGGAMGGWPGYPLEGGEGDARRPSFLTCAPRQVTPPNLASVLPSAG